MLEKLTWWPRRRGRPCCRRSAWSEAHRWRGCGTSRCPGSEPSGRPRLGHSWRHGTRQVSTGQHRLVTPSLMKMILETTVGTFSGKWWKCAYSEWQSIAISFSYIVSATLHSYIVSAILWWLHRFCNCNFCFFFCRIDRGCRPGTYSCRARAMSVGFIWLVRARAARDPVFHDSRSSRESCRTPSTIDRSWAVDGNSGRVRQLFNSLR